MKLTRTSFTSASRAFSKRTLSGQQKETMLAHIYAQQGARSPLASRVLSPYQHHVRNPYAVIAAVFLILSSGTAYAANQSLPGDALYDIKVHVLEPLALTLQVSDDDKNKYRAVLVEKRAQELLDLHKKTDFAKMGSDKGEQGETPEVKEHGTLDTEVRVPRFVPVVTNTTSSSTAATQTSHESRTGWFGSPAEALPAREHHSSTTSSTQSTHTDIGVMSHGATPVQMQTQTGSDTYQIVPPTDAQGVLGL